MKAHHRTKAIGAAASVAHSRRSGHRRRTGAGQRRRAQGDAGQPRQLGAEGQGPAEPHAGDGEGRGGEEQEHRLRVGQAEHEGRGREGKQCQPGDGRRLAELRREGTEGDEAGHHEQAVCQHRPEQHRVETTDARSHPEQGRPGGEEREVVVSDATARLDRLCVVAGQGDGVEPAAVPHAEHRSPCRDIGGERPVGRDRGEDGEDARGDCDNGNHHVRVGHDPFEPESARGARCGADGNRAIHAGASYRGDRGPRTSTKVLSGRRGGWAGRPARAPCAPPVSGRAEERGGTRAKGADGPRLTPVRRPG